MRKGIREYMQMYHMTEWGDGVLIGLSGGADSVCLLHLLWCLKEEMGLSLRALHVHHGLRGEEADRDAQFSRRLCEHLQIPFREERIQADEEAKRLGISVEEAGRLARYRLFEEVAEQWEREAGLSVHIAVAHHGNDNAETILHHLLRGSGLKGLGGIPPVRERIIRPLLWAEREKIDAYLRERKLNWVEDSSNQENEYTRNRIRNELIPLAVREINTQAVSNILRAGERIRQADAYFEQQAGNWLSGHGTLHGGRQTASDKRCSKEKLEYRLDLTALRKEPEILKGYLIRGALAALSCPLKDLTAHHVEEVLSLTEKKTGKQVMLPHGIVARREYDELVLGTACVPEEDETEEKTVSPVWNQRIFPCENPGEFPKNQYTKWFDYDKIKGTISLRTRRTGDYITLSGGGRKTVKSYMIDAKIPQKKREQILLLAEGSHILWIAGYRISEYYKVTAQTKTVLEVHLDGGNDSGA